MKHRSTVRRCSAPAGSADYDDGGVGAPAATDVTTALGDDGYGPEGAERRLGAPLPHQGVSECLLRWYRDGVDPQSRLLRLSTFMGHVDPTSTAVYLTITPQLFAEANRRFEAFAEPAWQGVDQ